MHSFWETKQRDAAVVGWFTPVSLFVYGDDQFANLSVPFQVRKRHATWHTTIRRPTFPKFTIKLFAVSFKLGFSSGIREHIDAQFYGSFHLCKFKISRLENFAQFCQVRCQCWQKESSMLKFFFFISRIKKTHIASFFFFWQLLQCGPNNQNLTPYSHCCLTRQPPCFECTLQLPTFCPCTVSLMHRQASWSQRWKSKTLP